MAYINIVTQSELDDYSHNHNQKLVGKYFFKNLIFWFCFLLVYTYMYVITWKVLIYTLHSNPKKRS